MNGRNAEISAIPFVFTPSEMKHAIGIDKNGLPMFPPIPIKYTHTPIRPRRGHMWLWCPRCSSRKHYSKFRPIDAAKSASPACKRCRLDKTPRIKPWSGPRRLCMASNGEVYMHCRTCGRYRHTSKVEPTRLTTKRRICNKCHKAESQTKKYRPYIVRRKATTRTSRDRRCKICHMYSSSPVCTACSHGIKPVPLDKTMHSGRNINLISFVLDGFKIK